MYNLNVNLAQSAANAVNSLLSVDNACTTPRTPEILNSLIAMTNPLDNYTFGDEPLKTAAVHSGPPTNLSHDSNSSSCSQLESPTTNTPPSVQHTCSQLIKAGLKLSIEQKRKYNSESEDLLDLDHCKRIKKSESESDEKMKGEGLTAEDEERRRRRRERNKIAATKCRLKKREKTINLIQESQTLDDQNIDFKKQVQELQSEQRQLLEMLASHRPHCKNNVARPSRDLISRLPPFFISSVSSNSSSLESNNHSFSSRSNNNNNNNNNIVMSRPSSVEPRSRTLSGDVATYEQRPASVCVPYSTGGSRRAVVQYNKLPNIIVDSPTDGYQQQQHHQHHQQLTNLDDGECISYHYSNQLCHSYNSNNQNYNGNNGMDSGCMA